jgi:hypothetical protein
MKRRFGVGVLLSTALADARAERSWDNPPEPARLGRRHPAPGTVPP